MPTVTVNTSTRRTTSRLKTNRDLWVYWRCAGRDDVSPVKDIGVGGLFLTTRELRRVTAPVLLDFLVPEGVIRAEAAVRHVIRGAGIGLQFTAIPHGDRPRLAALLARLSAARLQPPPRN